MIPLICVGAGYFARFHLEAWARMPGVSLKALCDLDGEKAREYAEEFGIPKVYQDYREMIAQESADVIDIITPPETHTELVSYAASQGLHIICQKPLAPTLSEAQEMVQFVQEKQLRFLIHENFRFQPWYRKLKELIEAGAIGDRLHTIGFRMRMGDGWPEDAYLSRQPYFRTMPRLLIYETGVHFIDVFRYLGGEITEVYARLRRLNPVIQGEDAGMVFFTFANGAEGLLDANRFNEANHPNPRYTFGTMLIEGNGGSLRLGMDGSIRLQALGKAEEEIDYVHGERNFGSDCVYATQQHLAEAIRLGRAAEGEAEDYLRNLLVQEAVYRSAKENRPVQIPPDFPIS